MARRGASGPADGADDRSDLDIGDVFRRPEFVPDVVREASARMERTGDRPVIWTQIGVHNAEAEAATRGERGGWAGGAP